MLYGYCVNANQYFEPIDQVKGDVARTVMYLWTTYNNTSKPLTITSVFKDFDTLLSWHTLDRPDAIEGNRNDYSEFQSKQKNRNPFVDHPELAWKIFGNEATSSVKTACMNAYPANGGDPIDPTGITLNRTEATVQINNSLQLVATLQPSGATGNISWTSSNPAVATVSNNGLVNAFASGDTTITATVGSYSATCAINVPEGINYGSESNPLNIEQAKAAIDRNTSTLSDSPLYVRGMIYTNSVPDS